MKIVIRICNSIRKKNKGFSFGIFVISTLAVAIAFLGANFGVSSNDTIMQFISDSKAPEAIYVTDFMSKDTENSIMSINGVKSVSSRIVFDSNMEKEDGSIFAARILSFDENGPFRQIIHEKIDADSPRAMISGYFAEYNDIKLGDVIWIEDTMLTVESIVSNPETMECVKDEISSYEDYQFAYIYVPESDFDKFFPMTEMRNQFIIYFDDDMTKDEEKKVMDEVKDCLNEHLIQETYVEESDAFISIYDDLKTISVLCTFIPGIIWLISLGFIFIFIRIIIENQRKTIGMLRAIGYSINKAVLIFVAYTVFINLPAIIVGVPIGYILLKTCVGAVASSEGIIDLVITIKYGLTILMCAVIFAIGIIAALLSSRAISEIDPSKAFGGNDLYYKEPPKLLSNMNADAFIKISIGSVFRNSKRQVIGALCITACIICMCVGFEGVKTIGHPINAVYGDRFKYDFSIRNVNEEECLKIKRDVNEIDICEPFTYFTSEFEDNNIKISTITEDSKLVILNDKDGNNIYPGSGVIIDEMMAKVYDISVGDNITLEGTKLEVTGIAREILYTFFYISPDTAEKMGHNDINGMYISCRSKDDKNIVKNRVTDISPNAYIADFSLQKEEIKDGFFAMRMVMLIFAILAFLIGSFLIFNMTLIDFNENRVRYASLRAIGTPVNRMLIISITQNAFRVVLGIILALPLCYIASVVLLGLLSGLTQQYVMVEFAKCLIVSCVIPFIYIGFGVLIASHKIKKIDISSYLNEVE